MLSNQSKKEEQEREPMSVVLDSSVTLAWAYAEENTAAVREVFDNVRQAEASVPSIWRWPRTMRMCARRLKEKK